ncbi:MBL fold metallo-hydrolase [Patescibacteria group bacterium]
MNIIWKGQSCFQITTQKAKIQINIIIDPFKEETGLRVSSMTADIVLITHNHPDHNNVKAVSGEPFVASGPGEYDVKDIYIQGISSWHDNVHGKELGENTIYIIDVEGLRLCHLGDIGQKELTDDQLEKIGSVDVLFVPVGGNSTISAKEALNIMSQIEPETTIPMHYQIPKLKYKLDGVEKFLKSLGIKSISPEAKLSIKKKDLSTDEAKIVVLKP